MIRARTLVRRSLRHYWRTNLAVMAGVAVAVAVLAGALLVGDSVRASLRALALERLGSVSHLIASENFFREQLAADLAAQPQFAQDFRAAAPAIALEAVVTHERSGRRAAGVQVFGVDERFWKLHGRPAKDAPRDREVLLSAALAAEFAAQPGDAVLLRVQNPAEIPVDSLHGRKDELGRTLRLRTGRSLEGDSLGEFSLRPQQGAVRAVFVPLARLQEELKQPGKVNTVLLEQGAATPPAADALALLQQALHDALTLEDLGLRIELSPVARENFAVTLQSEQILLPDGIVAAAEEAARDLHLQTEKLFSYLATRLRVGEREIPYSLVTGRAGSRADVAESSADTIPPIYLSDWAWSDLSARRGDTVTLEFLVWEEGGHLVTRRAEFRAEPGPAVAELARDPLLVPQFPGISASPNLSDWNPPFPVDLTRIRPRDEDYWHRYRTTPMAIVPLEVAQRLWRSRYGQLTSLRFFAGSKEVADAQARQFADALRRRLNPARAGFAVAAVRAEALAASQGAVNFGEYFVYFSFFLVVSAILLAGLFFRLGVEQRLREIGLLRAIGFTPRRIRKLFLREGLAISALGALAGLAGAVGYAALMMVGLRTWWVDAVGTTFLTLDVSPRSLLAGALGGIFSAVAGIALTLRALGRSSPRALLHGEITGPPEEDSIRPREGGRTILFTGMGAIALAVVLLAAALGKQLNAVAGFFGAGSLLLVAMICFTWNLLARPAAERKAFTAVAQRPRRKSGAESHGFAWLGMRNAAWRPGRSLLSIALMASATFILVAVDAFRRTGDAASLDPRSGTGGFALVAETLLPVPYDPNTPENLRSLNLGEEEIAVLHGVKFFSFRLRDGEDASCLNLYQPRNPRILGVPDALAASGRFAFSDSLAGTEEQKQNPWLLLGQEVSGGAVPAIVDANSLAYVLNRKLGDDFVVEQATDPATGRPLRLKFVAALRDSIFQSEILIAAPQFLRLFPYEAGYRAFLLDVPQEKTEQAAATLEQALADYGFDAQATGERLAVFHRVENAYISIFQLLGGLGLLLGTLGLAAVLLRNVLERRRELALLRAVGFRPSHLTKTILAENGLLLAVGLAAGVFSALVAIAPALLERGGAPPGVSLMVLLAAVLLAGIVASLAAVRVAVRSNLLAALRSE